MTTVNRPDRNSAGAPAKLRSHPPRPFPPAEHRERLRRLQQALVDDNLDAAVIASPVQRLYLTGFPSTNGLLLVPADGAPIFFTDFRYLEAADRALPFVTTRQLPRRIERAVVPPRGRRWSRIGYEAGWVPATRFESWRRSLPRSWKWRGLDAALTRLRAVKSPAEIRAIRASVAANDAAFARLRAAAKPGMTEWDIRGLARRCIDQTSQGESFPVIVASGPNSSRCHHIPTERVWRERDPLLIDMGALVDNYCSDMTRVVFAASPSSRMRRFYTAVLDAQMAAIEAIRPGAACRAVDRAARRRLAQAGLDRLFGHGLGHGVGLEIHEAPTLAARRPDVLEAGMVVTVEPGVYQPGLGGIRIEDMVLVTASGREVLTGTPKSLDDMIG